MKLKLSPSPHIHCGTDTANIMLTVLLALLPAVIASVYIFGCRAILIYIVTMASCLIFEWLSTLIMKRKNSLTDFSALVTGLLLAMNLPVTVPLWICPVGAFVAVIIAKAVFGGLGANLFNPALVARIFLLVSFPVYMTAFAGPDGLSGATPLSLAKTQMQVEGSLDGFIPPDLMSIFTGFTGGSLGETSALALLIGAVILLLTRTISWHIPVSFIGTVFLLTLGHTLAHPGSILPPVTQILSGGLMLGAFFMATDYVTSPVFTMGKIIFGIGCGVITVVIRIFGGYPEGVAFAILLMNALTPLLDKFLRPRVYGEVRGA